MPDHRRIIPELSRYGRVFSNEPLAKHCTWRIGGLADALIEPSSRDSLLNLVSFLNRREIPWLVIGAGSNLLFNDRGVRGVVIKIGRTLSSIRYHEGLVICQAGIWVPHLARNMGAAGLSGIEHAVGIPGTLGGLVAMNGGSQGRSIGQNVHSVVVLHPDGRVEELPKTACLFSYRSSRFKDQNSIILEVTLQLNPDAPKSIRNRMLSILQQRRAKFPLKEPSCGSVFLSDPRLVNTIGPPGVVLDQMGFKGFTIGGAKVSEKHANFIVNTGKATAQDVLRLVAFLQEQVFSRYGYALHCEFRYVTEEGTIQQPIPRNSLH